MLSPGGLQNADTHEAKNRSGAGAAFGFLIPLLLVVVPILPAGQGDVKLAGGH